MVEAGDMKVLGRAGRPRPDRPGTVAQFGPDARAERDVAAVRRYVLAEEPFGRVAKLAAVVAGASSASVVIAAARQAAGRWRVAVSTASDPGNPAGESLCHYVIDSNEPLLIDDARREQPAIAGVPAGLASVTAWAGFPVRDPTGCAIGALSVTGAPPRVWTTCDVEVLTMLAAVVAREAALQFLEEHAAERAELARTLQESLLPPRLPGIPGLQVAASYAAGGTGSEVLGDFYDVFPSVRGSWGLVVGDVCGKGAPAAKSTALARYTLRAQAHRGSRPSVILAGLNQALLEWDTDDRRFVTAIYATVRPMLAGALVQVSAAGHPLALVRHADGTVRTLGRPGTLLGLVPELELHDTRLLLRPGETLILYTDGVTEARSHLDRQLYGEDRLADLVADLGDLPGARTADAIMKSVRAFSGGNLADDTVVLALKLPQRSAA